MENARYRRHTSFIIGAGWFETFVSLNRTSAVRPRIDQVRSFVGLGFKLSKNADLEAGYLNQYLNRANGDFSNQALSLSLSYKF